MTTVTTTTTTTYGGPGGTCPDPNNADRAQNNAERTLLRLFRANGNGSLDMSTLTPEFTRALGSLGISEPQRGKFTQRQAYAASVVRDTLQSMMPSGAPITTELLQSVASNPNLPADVRDAFQFTLSSGAWHEIEMLDTYGGDADGKSSLDNFSNAASSWGY